MDSTTQDSSHESVALDLTKMASFVNNDALDEYLESVVPERAWVTMPSPKFDPLHFPLPKN